MSESACRYCGECGRGHVCEGMYHAEIKKWTSMYHAAIHERDEARTQFELESKATVHFRQMADRLQAVIDGDKVSKELARVLNKTVQERDEAARERDIYLSSLTTANKINARVTAERDLAQKAFDEENTIRIAAEVERDEWIARAQKCGAAWDEEVTKLKVDLARVQAEAAAMREMLTILQPWVRDRCIDYLGPHPLPTAINKVLATDAGRALLAELEQWRVTAFSREKLAEDTRAVLVHEREELKPLLAELEALRKVEEVAQMVVESEDPDALEEGDVIVEKGGDVWKAIEQAKREKKKP